MPAVLNAANEISVNAFLQKKIGFDDIATINRSVMLKHAVGPADTIENLHTVDAWARSAAVRLVADATNAAIAA
jgi:1-deoxy-D-xylulose-5-phosphate reductoisomerase